MPRVIISSGHTASNPGTVFGGLQEYEVARKIAKYALKYIRINGIISLSVPPNLELQQRIAWINKTGYLRETNDIAIEIHINDGGNSGLEAWYEGDGDNPSQGIAKIVTAGLSEETGLNIVGINSEYSHELRAIAFVHDLKPYSTVIECGYIDGDNAFLKEEANLEKCGKGIAKGILNYFGLEYRELPTSQASLISTPQAQPAPTQPTQQIAGQPVAQPMAQEVQASVQQMQQPVVQPMVQPIQTPAQQIQQPMQSMQQPVAQPVTQPVQTPTLKTQTDDFYDEDYDDYDDLDDYDWSTKPTTAGISVNPPQPIAAIPTVNTSSAAVNSLNNIANNNQTQLQNNRFSNQYANNQAGANFPTREQRKEMITQNYLKILGREPNQNDLNYFLNIGIREDELIKKMVDSQEHLELVAAKAELAKIKESYEQDKAELLALKSLTEDQKTILDQYNQSIDQKNIALNNLQIELKQLQQKQHSEPVNSKKPSTAKSSYKGTFADKFFKAISDILE